MPFIYAPPWHPDMDFSKHTIVAFTRWAYAGSFSGSFSQNRHFNKSPEFFDIFGRVPEKVAQYYQTRIVNDNSGMNVPKNIHKLNIFSIIQPYPGFFEYHAGISIFGIDGTMINLPS